MTPSDERIARVLLETRTIALVGASVNPGRDSYRVGRYLANSGYRVIPVNPKYVGRYLFGEAFVARLEDIKDEVQLVDIFRPSEAILPIVEEALKHTAGLRFVWMQLEIQNSEARAIAEAQGLTVIEDRCTLIEHKRLLSGDEAG